MQSSITDGASGKWPDQKQGRVDRRGERRALGKKPARNKQADLLRMGKVEEKLTYQLQMDKESRPGRKTPRGRNLWRPGQEEEKLSRETGEKGFERKANSS